MTSSSFSHDPATPNLWAARHPLMQTFPAPAFTATTRGNAGFSWFSVTRKIRLGGGAAVPAGNGQPQC